MEESKERKIVGLYRYEGSSKELTFCIALGVVLLVITAILFAVTVQHLKGLNGHIDRNGYIEVGITTVLFWIGLYFVVGSGNEQKLLRSTCYAITDHAEVIKVKTGSMYIQPSIRPSRSPISLVKNTQDMLEREGYLEKAEQQVSDPELAHKLEDLMNGVSTDRGVLEMKCLYHPVMKNGTWGKIKIKAADLARGEKIEDTIYGNIERRDELERVLRGVIDRPLK